MLGVSWILFLWLLNTVDGEADDLTVLYTDPDAWLPPRTGQAEILNSSLKDHPKAGLKLTREFY